MIPDEIKRMKPLSGKERLGANRDTEYLGAEDIDPGTEPILTIKAIYNGMVTLQRGKENKDVIVFEEERVNGIKTVRPLIVNSTNRKMLKKLFKAVSAETLEGKKIQLYIDPNVRDPSSGERVDGIRIRPKVPNVRTEPIICEQCGNQITAFGKWSAEEMAQLSRKQFGGHVYCKNCIDKMKAEQAAQTATETPEDTEQKDEVTDNA